MIDVFDVTTIGARGKKLIVTVPPASELLNVSSAAGGERYLDLVYGRASATVDVPLVRSIPVETWADWRWEEWE